jgi:hypothetical protein
MMSTKARRIPRISHLVVAGVLLGAGAGVAGIAAAEGGWGSADPPPSASTETDKPLQFSVKLQATGPGLSSEEAVQRTLEALGDASIASAQVIPAPADSGDTGRWLSIDLAADQPSNTKEEWLAQLVRGAVDDQMRTDEVTTNDVLSGAQLVTHPKSGDGETEPLGHGGVYAGQVFGSPTDEALREQVESTARTYGMNVISLDVLHPLESALVVRLTIPDGPPDGWNAESLENAIVGASSPDFNPNVEGAYIELDSANGEPLLTESYAYRVAEGGLWVAPGQDDRFGINHG